METTKIAVIGGTGKAGKYLIKELLNQGYGIKMLARNPEDNTILHPSLVTVEGNVRDYQAIESLLTGCSGVISTLGMGTKPNPTNIFSISTAHVLKAMARTGTSRYIVITGLNVDTPSDRKGHGSQAATAWMYANYPETTEDRQREYGLLAQSDVVWTMVRLPVIDLTDDDRPVTASLEDCPGMRISSTSLAKFLAGLLHTGYVRQAPFIADK